MSDAEDLEDDGAPLAISDRLTPSDLSLGDANTKTSEVNRAVSNMVLHITKGLNNIAILLTIDHNKKSNGANSCNKGYEPNCTDCNIRKTSTTSSAEPEDYTGKFTNCSFTEVNTKKSKKQETNVPKGFAENATEAVI